MRKRKMMKMKETKKIKSVEDFKELRKVVDELNSLIYLIKDMEGGFTTK